MQEKTQHHSGGLGTAAGHIQTTIAGIQSIEDVKGFLKEQFFPLLEQVSILRSKYEKQLIRERIIRDNCLENIEMREKIDAMTKQMSDLGSVISKLRKKIEFLKVSGGTASLIPVELAPISLRPTPKKTTTSPGCSTVAKG
jgi:hypothetical protein